MFAALAAADATRSGSLHAAHQLQLWSACVQVFAVATVAVGLASFALVLALVEQVGAACTSGSMRATCACMTVTHRC